MGDARPSSSHEDPSSSERSTSPPRSCLAGLLLGGVFLVGRRALAQLVAALFLFVYLAIGGVLVFSSMAPGLVQAAFFLGVPVILGAILLARDSPRRATVLLSVTYVAAWASLLSWNAAEGRRLTGLGV